MKELSISDARKLLETPSDKRLAKVPDWFLPEHIRFLFPVDRRPNSVPIVSPPSTLEGIVRTSARREEDENRRRAMHTLVTSWDKSAKLVARELIDVVYRGCSLPPAPVSTNSNGLSQSDAAMVAKYASLIPGSDIDASDIIRNFSASSIPQLLPVTTVGGYSVTQTVGPLAMLSRACRYREVVTVWVKEKVEVSHNRRRVRIVKREGRIVLFDRHMNLVFVPQGNAADNWQFIRGTVIALIQRSS